MGIGNFSKIRKMEPLWRLEMWFLALAAKPPLYF